VVGIGQRVAGDDGAGLAVIDELRCRKVPAGVELVEAGEDADLVSLLESDIPVILVDAVLASPPGAVLELTPADLAAGARPAVSSHGLGVARAVELARVLHGERFPPRLEIVAIGVEMPGRHVDTLSAPVQAAVSRAADMILERLGRAG
jgi:hydrogenase maturation protease